MAEVEEDKKICVECGRPAPFLYRYYGKETIKLEECVHCKSTVDKYVEFDLPLILIDLLLQYTSAYRHLFINLNYKSYWRLLAILCLLDAHRKWSFHRELSQSTDIHLESRYYAMLFVTVIEVTAFSLIVMGISWLCKLEKSKKWGEVFWITCCGFYGFFFSLISVVWDLHNKTEYMLLLSAFLLISHYQIQRVLFPYNPRLNLVVVILATLGRMMTIYGVSSAFEYLQVL